MNSARKIQVGILCLVAFALLFGAFGRVSNPSATAAAATTGGLNGGGTNGQTIPPHYEIDWTGTSGVRNSGPAPTLTQYWDNPEHVASNYSNQSSEGAGIFTGGMHGTAVRQTAV